MMVEYTDQYGNTKSYKSKQKKQSNTINNNQSLVVHPRHYNREGAIECIDEMELVFGPEATAHFCLLNCWKYRYRAGLKNNGYQDLEKSDWYMQKYKELREKTKSIFMINTSERNSLHC